MPTFLIFKNTKEVTRIQGANTRALSTAIQDLATEAGSASSSSSSSSTSAIVPTGFGAAPSSSSSGPTYWLGAQPPKGYKDITSEVDVRGLDLLNADSAHGSARILFDASPPGQKSEQDWVESDTCLLYTSPSPRDGLLSRMPSSA